MDNMGYALPITQVKYIWQNLLDNDGVVKRAMLGVDLKTTASSLVYKDGVLTINEQVVVDSTKISNTAAGYNKLQFGDVFKAIMIIPAGETSGKEIVLTRRFQISDLLLTVRKGDTVVLTMLRDGTETKVTIVYNKDSYFKEYK